MSSLGIYSSLIRGSRRDCVKYASQKRMSCNQQNNIPKELYTDVSNNGKKGSFAPNIKGRNMVQKSSRGIKPVRYNFWQIDRNVGPCAALSSSTYDTKLCIPTIKTCSSQTDKVIITAIYQTHISQSMLQANAKLQGLFTQHSTAKLKSCSAIHTEAGMQHRHLDVGS